MTETSGLGRNPTRQRIIDASLSAFCESGSSDPSMRELALAAGVSVRGLYYHFDSKEALVRAVLEETAQRLLAPAAPLPPDVAGRVRAQAGSEFDAFSANPKLVGFLAMESVRRQPDAIELLMAGYMSWHERWTSDILGRAIDLDPAADLESAATMITTFLWGLNIRYVMTLDIELRERVESLATLVRLMIAVRAA
jgi:AcrR family transcriptional regulator